MSKKLTPWFPQGTQPARPGYYIATVTKTEVFYRYWDGFTWYYGGSTLPGAVARMQEDAKPWWGWPLLHWRGLAKKPATKDAA